jgi:prepilin-type N-terminal cleavage/methylation domain-containing protein
LSLKRGPRAAQGFTLAELAVVMMIVALLLGSMMYTLSVQLEQRAIEETRSRLEAARQLLLSFAIVNGRLPCPATAASLGAEAFTGANCTSPYGGFLPAKTIGYQVVDAGGYAIDSWQNRIRYAVSAAALTGCAGSSTLCGAAPANALTNQTVVVAIVHSIGKNGSLPCGTCVDEAANTNGDRVFVSHTLAPAGAPNGEFDDQLIWITVGELYGRMISAGVLP